MILTEEIVNKGITDFFLKNPSPLIVFGTGTSCAIDIRFGMSKLKEELIEKVPQIILGKIDLEKEWFEVVNNLNSNIDLEHSMDRVKSEELIKTIVNITAEFVSLLDRDYLNKIYFGEIEWPCSFLLKRLVDGLPESSPILHVVTPNYDMLAEYAFERCNIPYINGFWGNICKKIDWNNCQRTIKMKKDSNVKGKKKESRWNDLKHINLYKVHGSLNTFLVNGEVIENNFWHSAPPENCERLMITPGMSKYEKITTYRNELLRKYDEVVEGMNSFLFMGYGFNDTHIERYVRQKLTTQKCHGIIVTRDYNDRIQELMNESDNLWLICMEEKSSKQGTRIFNKRYEDWLYLYDKQLWEMSLFTKFFIGD